MKIVWEGKVQFEAVYADYMHPYWPVVLCHKDQFYLQKRWYGQIYTGTWWQRFLRRGPSERYEVENQTWVATEGEVGAFMLELKVPSSEIEKILSNGEE